VIYKFNLYVKTIRKFIKFSKYIIVFFIKFIKPDVEVFIDAIFNAIATLAIVDVVLLSSLSKEQMSRSQ
jgi:hypothetical protein